MSIWGKLTGKGNDIEGDPKHLKQVTRNGSFHGGDSGGTSHGLSGSQHSLRTEERAAAKRGDWETAADKKQMLDNADSRSFWERMAGQVTHDDYPEMSDAEFRRFVGHLQDNAKNAPNR